MAGKKLIILVAPTGNQKDVPGSHVPVTPDEIAEESFRCYKAGAAVVHIHARDPKTRLASGDMKIFGQSIRRIKEKSDILVQTTTSLGLKQDLVTGKWVWHSSEERMGLLTIDPPQDLLSCAMGSWEFIHPEGGQGNPTTQINGYEFMKNNISNMIKRISRGRWKSPILASCRTPGSLPRTACSMARQTTSGSITSWASEACRRRRVSWSI